MAVNDEVMNRVSFIFNRKLPCVNADSEAYKMVCIRIACKYHYICHAEQKIVTIQYSPAEKQNQLHRSEKNKVSMTGDRYFLCKSHTVTHNRDFTDGRGGRGIGSYSSSAFNRLPPPSTVMADSEEFYTG